MAAYNSIQEILDEALLGLSYYESIGQPEQTEAFLEAYGMQGVHKAAVSFIGAMLYTIVITSPEIPEELEYEEAEQLAIQVLRNTFIDLASQHEEG